ncbi:MAG TPA: TM0106 family RecB-like putative nuclease [Candidatus Acidoferrales bacterium]|nr:TM0106 family RecB-like putative nuclease [Candidatus Acidoferrales bacterium]
MFTPTMLADFVACEHLAALSARVAAGNLVAPALGADARLVLERGREHELDFVRKLRDRGIPPFEVSDAAQTPGRSGGVRATRAAMESGAAVIHGAVFDVAGWTGVADFLLRVERPSRFGSWSYEAADAKISSAVKPVAIIQLCAYSEFLAREQGVAPERMHVILGDGRTESFRCTDYMAYYRSAKDRFVSAMHYAAPTYPEPVEHCARCGWDEVCRARRRADDHLSLVAHILRSQMTKLAGAGITTLTALAQASDDARPRRLEASTFAKLRAQAALQVGARTDQGAHYEFVEEAARGFGLLPEPDPGDIFFDIEGDPFVEDGLEYLFGAAYVEEGELRFLPQWGHDRAQEKRAFEQFIDFVVERRKRYPNLHIYHYWAYEVTAVRRLMCVHQTREAQVDALLRERVFVDLYAVVRSTVRISQESYSLKSVEHLYDQRRTADVKDAMGSVVAYEGWRVTGDPRLLEEIERYNRDDCFSTAHLHRWLLERRAEVQARTGAPIPWRERATPEPPAPALTAEEERVAALHDALVARGYDLAAAVLGYHRREDKPQWWAHFDRLQSPLEEMFDDTEAIGGLVVDRATPPVAEKRSWIHTLAFPAQEHKLRAGDNVVDHATRKSAGTIAEIDNDTMRLRLLRGPSLANVELPCALLPPTPMPNKDQRDALCRLATALCSDESRRYAALRDVLAAVPRFRRQPVAGLIDDGAMTPQAMSARALDLDESYLFVQGPPGSGKTWSGARVIVDLVRAGKRVGIAANSHAAIHNVLREIERVAFDDGFSFRGLKKASKNAESAYVSAHGFISSSEQNEDFPPGSGVQLVAGTAWLFSRPAMDDTLDYLVIDEAGQVALADALAMGTSARNLIVLGDPLQLAQVSTGMHPQGAGRSVLEHLLGERGTVAPDRGVFLGTSWRMHPEVCAFVSEVIYDGRLHAAPRCNEQRVEGGYLRGHGLRYMPVVHAGNARTAPEEVQAIADAIGSLRGGTATDADGTTRPLALERDVLVVAPYNAQVAALEAELRVRGLDAVRVGTVDRFQGQEAHVVFFSLTTSSGEEIPRGPKFLLSRNRLNVAISRARSLAVLVCSPELLRLRCSTVEQMQLVNALCRYVEMAQPLAPADFQGGAPVLTNAAASGD